MITYSSSLKKFVLFWYVNIELFFGDFCEYEHMYVVCGVWMWVWECVF